MSSNLNDEVIITDKSLTYRDFIKFAIYHRQKFFLIFFIIFFLFFLILYSYPYLLYLFLMIMYGKYGDLTLLFLFNALKASLPTGALVLFTFILIWLRVRKEYKSDSLARYDFSYTINQEGINQKIRKSNMHVEWKDVYKFLEKKDMFLIYVSKNKAIILPKRYFDTDQEIVLFKKLAQVNLPKKKIKIK